jgi:methionyl aminopeptidase
MAGRRGVVLKSKRELDIMRRAGRINALALMAAADAAQPGATTKDIDAAAAEVLRSNGAEAAFMNYPGAYPFPAVTTVSINDVLVHGIPDGQVLREGDLVSIDCGSVVEGFVADSALTVAVGKVSPEAQRLLEVTRDSLFAGIEKMRIGNRTGDVSAAIQKVVEDQSLNVVREYTGHGVGQQMHEDPQVPNYGTPGKGIPLRAGMTIALEPMVLAGSPETRVLDDQWGVASRDGNLTAHFEHTVAVTEEGARILTLLDEELDGEAAFRYNGYFAGTLKPSAM